MKCLLCEPEQKASARRSVCINEGYESIFLGFARCAWARAELQGAQIPTALNSMTIHSDLLAPKAILQTCELLSYPIQFI